MFKIKIILHFNIFYLKKMKFLLRLTIFMIKIFKIYNFFILCYLIYKNNIYIYIYIYIYMLNNTYINIIL